LVTAIRPGCQNPQPSRWLSASLLRLKRNTIYSSRRFSKHPYRMPRWNRYPL
jgi:hypothetical protein